MKKQFLLIASFAFSVLSFAQSTSPSFGIKAGIVSATVKGDAASNLDGLLDFTNGAIATNSHTGFYGGGYASIPVGGTISIEPGLYYAQKGYELKGELNLKGLEFIGANAKAAVTSHYIDLPVLVKANINGLQVFAGPQVSYLAKADLKTTAGLLGFNVFKRNMDATEQLNRWDAGLTGGAGYQFSNGLNISASYDHGLMKADKNKNLDAYNRAFKVGLGFSF